MRQRERDACGIGFVADARGRESRAIVATALEALRRMRHRGAVAADGVSGDGAGLLAPIPRGLFGDAGVAMAFLPPDGAAEARSHVERGLREEGLDLLRWRVVPTDDGALGPFALRTRPRIEQALIRPRGGVADPERAAFRARKRIEALAREAHISLYLASLSFRTVTYKALCAADQLSAFFGDLTDPSFRAPFAIVHQRYSTNTAPTWERAQPFRLLCHNGEINTIRGNVHAMRARRGALGNGPLGRDGFLSPVIDEGGSDSAMLDNALELLVRGGRSVEHALAMLVPPAWEGNAELDPEVRDFHHYHACLTEPWDGPAGLVFTDGRVVGAGLDRNGLRPLRTLLRDDGIVYVGSEAGAVDAEGRARRGRLGPGQMLLVDPVRGVLADGTVKRELAARQPYGVWLACYLRLAGPGEPVEIGGSARHSTLARGARARPSASSPPEPPRLQAMFGWTKEEVTVVVRPMALTGKEAVSSMGDDTAEPPLASRVRPAFGYLRQRFAQVTNPPIDHQHERLVTSLATRLGARAPLVEEREDAAALVELPTFFLYPEGLERLTRGPLPTVALDATFPVAAGPAGLARALRRLAGRAREAIRRGTSLLVVSDMAVGPERAPVPILLAVGAVHQGLIRAGLRTRASIVADTGEAREVHHAACLLGCGADAIVPRLALQTIAALAAEGRLGGGVDGVEGQQRFHRAIEEGVLKVMAKMGIATLDAYRGAQVFEAIGLSDEVVDLCFADMDSPLGGLGFEELGQDALERHAAALEPRPMLANPGFVKHRTGGEYHATNPAVVRALHDALHVGESDGGTRALSEARSGEGFAAYARFAELVDGRPPAEPRDLLEPVAAGPPVPLEEVEPREAIVRRFSSGAMSHGALSVEAHEAVAAGLNLVGGRANTGEGGEDRARYRTERNSRIKQVASARFGVTPEYLAFADELQIKMAQGSKPGEGGQLPGHKVTAEIARLRHTTPGVPLISPPPHHDIYSIEDLAQLIHDLKQANPSADVSVKLVSTVGVGVIACGVAKGLADVIHIAGSDGGTGASPLSSIKYAGLPWEVGLAEAQAELEAARLRGRVRLRADGGMKTGRDVLLAALLGADEVSFGTAVLLAQGCIMVRACHRDTCPTGIATQRPDLRAKFAGTPEQVAAYLLLVAEDVRRRLAALGLRSLDEAIGRTDLLRAGARDSARGLEVERLLREPGGGPRRFVARDPVQRPDSPLGDRVTEDALPAILAGRTVRASYPISNADRSVGARLSVAVAREFGDRPPPGSAVLSFDGSAGQSFGAFLSDGVELRLTGEANDYVGKGMSGGRIVIVPPTDDAGDPVLTGNTALYGATGGELFVAGRAGERFAVRASGVTAVVEGAGDHACEYMTAGTVVVLGPVGRNLGAGMSGGECFLHDPDLLVARRLNPAMVDATPLDPEAAEGLRTLIERHAELTSSEVARALLFDWDRSRRAFVRVAPRAREIVAPPEEDLEEEAEPARA